MEPKSGNPNGTEQSGQADTTGVPAGSGDSNIESMMPAASMKATMVEGANRPALSVGTISAPVFLWEALSAITRAENVRNAVLIIFSLDLRGSVGIFCNRYLSGAIVQDSDASGLEALKKLLAVRSGIFAFRACLADESLQLKQGLALDLSELLALRAESGRKFATPADALGDMTSPGNMASLTAEDALPGTFLSDSDVLMHSDGNVGADKQNKPEKAADKAAAADQGKSVNCFELLYGAPSTDSALPNLRQILMPALPPAVSAPDGAAVSSYQQLVEQELAKVNQHLEKANQQADSVSSSSAQINRELQLFTELLESERKRAKKWSSTELKAIPTPQVRNVEDAAAGQLDLVSAIMPKLSSGDEAPPQPEHRLPGTRPSVVVRVLKDHRRPVLLAVAMVLVAAIGFGVYRLFASTLQDLAIAEAKAQQRRGAPQLAADKLSQVIADSPDFGRAYFYRGLAYMELGKAQQALADFDMALSCGENPQLVLVARASGEERMNQYDKAMRDVNTVLLDDPKNLAALQLRILLRARLREFGNAITDCTKALQLTDDPELTAALLQQRGFAEARNHDWRSAQKDLTDAIGLKPGILAYIERADVERALGMYVEAIADYSKVIAADPQSYDAYVARGLCRRQLHQNEKAVSDFTHALAINGQGAAALFARGSTYLDARDWQRAADDLQHVAKIDPHAREVSEKLQLAVEKLRHSNKPVAQATVAAVADSELKLPDNVPELLRMGYKLSNEGEYRDAIACFSAAIRKEPSNEAARKYLAYTLAKSGDFANAALQMQGLATFRPLDDKDTLALGMWLEKSNRYEDSMDLLAQLVERSPDYLDAKALLAKIYFDYGFPKKGRALCTDAIARASSPAIKQRFEVLLRSEGKEGQ
jgi:tetratricopeptide (TPR) repeat protein